MNTPECKKCKKCNQKNQIAIWKEDILHHLIYESDDYCIECFFKYYETEITPRKYDHTKITPLVKRDEKKKVAQKHIEEYFTSKSEI